DIDIAVSSYYGPFKTYINDSHGSFALATSNVAPIDGFGAIVAADFDADGKMDIAITNRTQENIWVYFRGLDNNFSVAPVKLAAGKFPYQMKVADIDEDGHPDLIATDWDDADLSIQRYAGSRTFTASTLSIRRTNDFANAYGIIARDIDGDGHVDLIAGGTNSGYMLSFSGNGDGTFRSPAFLSTTGNPGLLAVGDLNGDTKLDIATGDAFSILTTTFTCAPSIYAYAQTPVVTVGQDAKIAARVAGVDATTQLPLGDVAIKEGATTQGSATIGTDGQTQITLSNLSTGTHTFTAAFSGNADVGAVTSSSFTVQVTTQTTTTTITPQVAPSVYGQSYSLTLSINSSTRGSILGYCIVDVDGVQSREWSGAPLVLAPAVGGHTVSAYFEGDTLSPPSPQTSIGFTTAKAPVTISTGSGVKTVRSGTAHSIQFVLTQNGGAPATGTIAGEIDSSPTTRGLQYEYRLDIIRNNTTAESSNIDSAMLFTDDTALTGTAVKLIHFNELRTAVNAMRTVGGLAPFNFDGTFGASALIRASHITALRTAATEARNALGLFPIAFNGSISAGTVIHATDMTE